MYRLSWSRMTCARTCDKNRSEEGDGDNRRSSGCKKTRWATINSTGSVTSIIRQKCREHIPVKASNIATACDSRHGNVRLAMIWLPQPTPKVSRCPTLKECQTTFEQVSSLYVSVQRHMSANVLLRSNLIVKDMSEPISEGVLLCSRSECLFVLAWDSKVPERASRITKHHSQWCNAPHLIHRVRA